MRMFLCACTLILGLLLQVAQSWACINDRRTRFFAKSRQQLRKEHRQQLKGMWRYKHRKLRRDPFSRLVQDMITGRFAKHSKRFHRWRVRDRLKKLKKTPKQLDLYDDLAASYDKLGQYDKAIATMRRKMALRPGVYETESNLGTFLIHKAIFQKQPKYLEPGLRYLKQAVKRNPNAHFGREIYQILLVEYVIQERQRRQRSTSVFQKRTKQVKQALRHYRRRRLRKRARRLERILRRLKRKYHKRKRCQLSRYACRGFAGFVEQQAAKGRKFVAAQYFPALSKRPRAIRDAALRGVLGMMRFGNHRSPILLSALGSLLEIRYHHKGQRLAAQAYLKASYEAKGRRQKAHYKRLARIALHRDVRRRYLRIRPKGAAYHRIFAQEFRKLLRRARRWHRRVQRKEYRWLRTKKDPELLFFRTFLNDPRSTSGRLLISTDREFSAGLARAFPITPSYLPKRFQRPRPAPVRAVAAKVHQTPTFLRVSRPDPSEGDFGDTLLVLLGCLALIGGIGGALYWHHNQQQKRLRLALLE